MQVKDKVEGELFSRAHFTLVGFNKGGYRKFGGSGFSFAEPKIMFQAVKSNYFNIELYLYSEKVTFESQKLINILEGVFIKKNLNCKATFKFYSKSPRHSGFGTGTNITLACIESLLLINCVQYSEAELIEMSGRGRTSGVGINTYFKGGFVMDIGVKNIDDVFLPSNLNDGNLTSKALFTCPMPNWEFIVCIPKIFKPLTLQEEKDFFISNTPFEEEEVHRTLYEVVFGISSAILEKDFETFCESLNNIQRTKWKSLERNNYGNYLIKVEKEFYKHGAKAIAMSSLGPALLVFADNPSELYSNIEILKDRFYVIKTRPSNTGRIIYD